MNNDVPWSSVEVTLKKAKFVLEKLSKILQRNNKHEKTQDSVNQAKKGIIYSLEDESILKEAWDSMGEEEYTEIVRKLEASEQNITLDEIQKARAVS